MHHADRETSLFLVINSNTRVIRLPGRFANQRQSKVSQGFVVWQHRHVANIKPEKLVQVEPADFRGNALKIFAGVTATAQVVTRIRTLKIKLFIHAADDGIKRHFTVRSSPDNQIEHESDQLALRVVAD